MNLAESACKWVLKNLPYDDTDAKIVVALNTMGPGDLLVLYLNWRDRLIPAIPRRVLRSSVFDQNPIVCQRAAAISQIIDDIEHGRDLTKYLSRRVKSGFTLPPKPGTKKLKCLKHLDLLLNDWGIHHLHISMNVEADGFVEHGDPLLFAIFKSERTYFIDVLSHRDFADDRLIHIILNTWPDDGLIFKVKGVLVARQSYTKEERTQLRSAGLQACVQIGGQLISPGTGISTAGTSAKASILSGRILRTLKHFQEQVHADSTRVVELMRQHGGNPPDKPDFEFSFFQDGFGVVETTTGFAIGLRI